MIQPAQRIGVSVILARVYGLPSTYDAATALLEAAIGYGRDLVPGVWLDGQPRFSIWDLQLLWDDQLRSLGPDPNGELRTRLLSSLDAAGFVLTISDWQAWTPPPVPKPAGPPAARPAPPPPEVDRNALQFSDRQASWANLAEHEYELRIKASGEDVGVLRTRPGQHGFVEVEVYGPDHVLVMGEPADSDVRGKLRDFAAKFRDASNRKFDLEYQFKVLGIAFSGLHDAVYRQVSDEKYSRAREVARAVEVAQVGNALVSDEPAAPSPTSRPISESSRAPFRIDELYDWQQEAAAAWLENGMRGVVEAVTGAGKTRIGLAAAAYYLGRDRANRIAVLVPKIELMHQWRRELASWLGVREREIAARGGGETGSALDSRVAVYVAASAAEHLPRDVRNLAGASVLLIADECHRYGSETYRHALEAPYAATLGFSATPERTHDLGMEEYVLPALGPIVYRYGYVEGLADGVISDFEVAFVGIEFDPNERALYAEHSARIGELRRSLEARYPAMRGRRDYFARLSQLARDEQDPLVLAFLGTVGERRQVLLHAASRGAFVQWLVTNLPRDEKTIAFHETIGGAEEIAEALRAVGIPAASHHSELAQSDRRRILDAFARGRLRAIAAPRTLDEGIDVPDASVAVLVAGSTVKRQRIQRIGRVLRHAPGKDLAHVVVLYVLGSREDPVTRLEGDPFAEAIETLDRAWYFRWPVQASELASWLREGLIDEDRFRKPQLFGGEHPVAVVLSADATVRVRVMGALNEAGVTAYWGESGDYAVEWVADHGPAIVVVDRGLQSAAGSYGTDTGSAAFRVCNGVRELPNGGHIVVVLLSGTGKAPAQFNADAAFGPSGFGTEAAEKLVRLAAKKSALS